MWKAIKRQAITQSENWGGMLFITLGGGVLGMILFAIIRFFLGGMDNAFFPLGALIAAIIVVVFGLFVAGLSVSIYFNIEVGMGSTRKEFLVSYYVVSMAGMLVNFLLLALIYLVECKLAGIFYLGIEFWELQWKLFGWILMAVVPLALGLSIVGIFCGVAVLHFGRKAFWLLWGLWMFMCLLFPRFMNAAEDAPRSLYGRAGNGILNMIRALPWQAWAGIAGLVCVVFLILSGVWLRRQQVTA